VICARKKEPKNSTCIVQKAAGTTETRQISMNVNLTMVNAKTASVSTQTAAIDATVTRAIKSQQFQMFV